jgi:very-short-patch-repair endonuclease
MGAKLASRDREIARIAARQHGVVSTRQLREAGVGRGAVRVRVEAGRLHRVQQGVYAVGHGGLSRHGRWMAAVLACGTPTAIARRSPVWNRPPNDGGGWSELDAAIPVLEFWGAALSHRSAAELWGLLSSRNGAVDVSVRGDGGRARRRGIRLHRSQTLVPAAVTIRSGIPVTTPTRTIADLGNHAGRRGAADVSPRELRRAVRQAHVLGLPLGEGVESDRTRSDLEGDFLQLCRRHRLPAPEVNVRIGRHLVDFLWQARRLVVETDFYGYHSGQAAFQDDRGRDLDLRRLGFTVIRLSEKQVDEEHRRVVEVLRATLTDHGAP